MATVARHDAHRRAPAGRRNSMRFAFDPVVGPATAGVAVLGRGHF
jgi:hypothetical protein